MTVGALRGGQESLTRATETAIGTVMSWKILDFFDVDGTRGKLDGVQEQLEELDTAKKKDRDNFNAIQEQLDKLERREQNRP